MLVREDYDVYDEEEQDDYEQSMIDNYLHDLEVSEQSDND